MTKRIVFSLIGGWIVGGIVFVTFFHQPLEYLAPAALFLCKSLDKDTARESAGRGVTTKSKGDHMKTALLFSCLLLFTVGCATQRYSLHEIQEYDQAIKLAESNGMDTTEMHKHIVEMLLSYMKNPGLDPYAKAAHDASEAMQINAAASMIQAVQPVPIYMPPPPPPPFPSFGR